MIMATLLFIMITVCRNNDKAKSTRANRVWSLFVTMLFVVSLFALVSMYDSGNVVARQINIATSNRVKYQSMYQKEPLSLFGKAYDFNRNPLDNVYYRTLYNYGIIGLTVLITVFSRNLYSASEKRDRSLLSILISLLAYGLSEAVIIKTVCVPFRRIEECERDNYVEKEIAK